MDTTDLLQKISEGLGSTATVKSVFGDPIHANGKTIVPVAKVCYGFGGGSGTGPDKADTNKKEGGGGGGGVRACPAGALEVTESGTRFIPYVSKQQLVAAFAAGVLLGALILRRSGK